MLSLRYVHVLCVLMLALRTSSAVILWGTPLPEIEKVHCEYDYIVVGSGPGGSRVAAKLLEQGQRDSFPASFQCLRRPTVLIIEAGDEPAPFMTIPLFNLWRGDDERWIWKYPIDTGGTSHLGTTTKPVSAFGGKVVGGGSSINGMAYQRGNREDYNIWAKNFSLGDEWAWPKVLETYMQDERNDDLDLDDESHGRDGPLPVTTVRIPDQSAIEALKRALFEHGIAWADHQGGDDLDRGYYLQVNTHRGQRADSCSTFLTPHLQAGRLHMMLRSFVYRVLFTANQRPPRAEGVEVQTEHGIKRCIARREVVLSAGALSTPRILMSSGIGDFEHLRKFNISLVHHNPHVGRNLQSHVGFIGIFLKGANASLLPAKNDWLQMEQFLKYSNGTNAANEMSAFGSVYFRSSLDVQFSDIEAKVAGSRGFPFQFNLDPQYDSYFKAVAEEGNVLTITIDLQRQKSRGFVRLNSSNPADFAEVNLRYLSEEDDITALVNGASRFLDIVRSKHFADINITLSEVPFPACAGSPMYSKPYLRCLLLHTTHNTFHFCGTAAMNGNPSLGVLDVRCKVKGVAGLRVADASNFPLVPTGHTTAPAYLVGARCGDFIVEDN